MSAVSAIGGYLFNLKGLNKKRIILRVINLWILFSLAAFIPYIAKDNTAALVAGTLIFVGVTAFFSLEEYLGGFLAHIPAVYIYIYSFFNKELNDYLKSLAGVLIGILVGYMYIQIFWKSCPNDKMKQTVEEYLDSLIKEVRSCRKGIDIQKTREEGRKAYKIFLNEFYKTSYGSYLGDEKAKKNFEFVLSLHELIEKFRIKNKKEPFTQNKYLELEMFLKDIKSNKDIDLEKLELPMNTVKVIYKNRKNLFSEIERNSDEKYKKNHRTLYYLKESVSLNTTRMRHAIQLAITFTIGIVIFQKSGMVNSVWLPTTMVVIAQPYGMDSKKKIWDRILGTIFGLLVVSIIIAIFPSGKGITVIAVLSVYLSFSLMRVSSIGVVMFATITAVLMSLSYLSPENSYMHRMLYTIMAGAIIFIVEFLLKDRNRSIIKGRLIRMIENDVVFLDEMVKLLKNKEKKHLDGYIVRGYIFRDILIKDLENAGEENSKMILKDSLVFMDKLKLIYSRIRSNDMDKKYIEVLILMSNFIKSSIVSIQTENSEEILNYRGKIEELLDSSIDDTMIIEILELMKHYIENFNNRNYFWKEI
ncbi:FUSC family protein [Psychrilyobacter piezotolerans]|uniref:FUSC family protein n=1 Tax=Psychrilyobacter piezotolerans TaxID=2293438 RepID=UPI00138A353F|nr:FUSC family protein [Psychrilyobacter piezotolerans]MCS5421308.1 FUSC family protein [Psychrilyobacter sp. S5]